MTVENWRSERRGAMEIPRTHSYHVEELLAIIELWQGGFPTAEQCSAMQRAAQAIREE